MNGTIFVTHVELSNNFIKIHGQTDRDRAMKIGFAMPGILNVFGMYPPPLINMLSISGTVLVYFKREYYRGKFTGESENNAINVLLIDLGYTVTLELANVRLLNSDICPKASQFILNEPAQANEFILIGCIINSDLRLSTIRDDILERSLPYDIVDEVAGIKRIALRCPFDRDYSEHLINNNICKEITADHQKRYLAPPQKNQLIPRPINKPVTDAARSINTTGKQMFNNHLKNNKVPQNMPSYQPRIDYNSNPINIQPSVAASQSGHYMPTFMSDTLIIGGQHQVYVSDVDDGPCMFSVQLKAYEHKLEEMMAAIEKCELKPLSRKPALGMACLARFSEDNRIYRAVIKSIHPDNCQLLYVDYGNSEKVLDNNIYDIPDEFLCQKTFAVRVTLAGLKTAALPDHVKASFKDIVTDKVLDMEVVPPDGKAFVQYCELTLNGENMLNKLKEIVSEKPKFKNPTNLSEDDSVVIRYVESPKLFCVQQTKNIVEYDAMSDKLVHYCLTAPSLDKIEIGMACAARFKSDAEWYRAEILNITEKNVLIRYVDYGIVLTTETNKLKEISYEFLLMPKQAVHCCLVGFDSMQTTSGSSQDQMELLAEDSIGERRNFRVKIHGNYNDTILVNLIDESQKPPLDLSWRMLQLSLPQKSFRQLEAQLLSKVPPSRQSNDNVNPTHLNGKNTSDSGFQDFSTSTSVWDTPGQNNKATARTSAQNNNRDDTVSIGVCTLSSTGLSDNTRNSDASDSKFYKNIVNPSCDNRNTRPAASNVRSEGVINPNTQIPFEELAVNNTQDVNLTWCISPLEFYISTCKSEADLTIQMNNIQNFYKNKPPVTKKVEIDSFVIAKYSKTNELHRAKIIDYNEKLNKYKAELIDVGAVTAVNASDVYEMDKCFAKLKRKAIPCSFSGVALCKSRLDMEGRIAKLMANKQLRCKFIQRKGDTYIVDIVVDGINVKEALIQDNYLSILSEDVEIERLVGQTVMAKVVSFKNLSSFHLVILGCGTIFEAECKDCKTSDKKLPTQVSIPLRIDKFAIGKTFSVSPLIDSFGESATLPIGSFPFFSNNFKVVVMHWEAYNVAYVQTVIAEQLAQSMLNKLFEYYDSNGDILKEFLPETFCAVKSADLNWYRAQIISETKSEVKVRYLDYGNCEIIPKNLVKRLESQFLDLAALAARVYLPLKKVYNDRETSVDDIVQFTTDISLDLTVLAYHAQNWIVDLNKEGTSITSYIKTKNGCKTMTVDELKKQIEGIELVKKANRLQRQIQEKNQLQEKESEVISVKHVKPVISRNAQSDVQQSAAPASKITSTTKPIQPIISQNAQSDVQQSAPPASKISSKTKAYISHIDRPDRFYLQDISTADSLDQLQVNIQIVAPSLPPLEDFSVGTRCIVRYSVDDSWYRAVIIDSDTIITSILFMDYGNTDTITDNSMIRSMNEAFDQIPAYAIPCALPLEAKDRNEWSDESCQLLKDLVNNEVEFEYACKGKANNFVKLYHGERDLMQELIQKGYAIKLETIKSGENCYVSHVNSISDFYIQMESDTDGLEKLADYLLDESKFAVLTDIKDGIVCAAKFMDDEKWYRGKIKSHTDDNTEVFFIDYGNSSLTNELRIIPPEIANAPSLAKYCSMVKPKDIQYWSENAEQRFMELNDSGTIFIVDVISPGKKSIVDLFVNEKSILEEISNLCDKYSLSALENTLQSNNNTVVASETFKALIVDGTPDVFYIQLDSKSTELDELWTSMEPAETWPKLEGAVVGQICAALFEGNYYRAKILSLNNEGASVHYVDYGNKSVSTDLRKLPENLQSLEQLAIPCSLESKNGTFSPELIERFAKLSRDVSFEMKYVSKNSSPAIVQLFENGVLFTDEPVDTPAPTEKKIIDAYISESISPSHFYIQLNNDMEEAMNSATEFPLLAESEKRVGKLCAALWEEAYYRAQILAVDNEGIKVHFIDFGNESYATDLRTLPTELEQIERASMLCTLENKNELFTDDFVEKFAALNLGNQYQFEIVKQSSPCVVRLYVDGKLFSDGLDSDNLPKNGLTEMHSDSIVNQMNERAEQLSVANEIVTGINDSSLNGTNADNISNVTDIAVEADRLSEVLFKSIEKLGLASRQNLN